MKDNLWKTKFSYFIFQCVIQTEAASVHSLGDVWVMLTFHLTAQMRDQKLPSVSVPFKSSYIHTYSRNKCEYSCFPGAFYDGCAAASIRLPSPCASAALSKGYAFMTKWVKNEHVGAEGNMWRWHMCHGVSGGQSVAKFTGIVEVKLILAQVQSAV